MNWCFGYSKLEEKQRDIHIPDEATHVLVIRGPKEVEARKYNSIYKFRKVYLDELILPYDDYKDIVYDNLFTGFNTMSLYEYMHLILPNKELEIQKIPVDYYLTGSMHPVFTEYTHEEEDYMCKCRANASKCNFHKFLIEKLYTKYKNAVFTTNSDDSNDDNYDRRLD
jgi:hypothetical protein